MDPFFAEKQLDKQVPIPFYYQLKELLLDFISGSPEYSQIPTENQLCEHFQISRTTVRQALGELVAEGYLIRQKGKGSMIAPRKIQQDFLVVLESFNDEMQSKGLSPKTEVLALHLSTPDPTVQKALGIDSSEDVVEIIRCRSINDEPIVLVSTYLPAGRFDLARIIGDDLQQDSMYHLMETRYQVSIDSSQRTLEIRLAGEFESQKLNVEPGAPLQYIETISKTSDDIPVEFSKAYYRGDKNKFTIQIRKRTL